MKKVLCCGFSHVGNAKRPLNDYVATHLDRVAFEFLATAGPKNRSWSARGGRYEVDGTRISRTGGQDGFTRDLADYHAILFIGQWTSPSFMIRGSFDWTQPLSDPLLAATMRGAIETPVFETARATIRFVNEPLLLFPAVASCPALLFADPAPCHAEYVAAPESMKRSFQDTLKTVCRERGVAFLSQTEDTLTEDLVTNPAYLRKEDDWMHMSDEFWTQQIDRVIGPRLAEMIG